MFFYFLQYLHRNFLQIFHEIDFCQHFLSFKTYHGRQGKDYRVNAQYNKRKFGEVKGYRGQTKKGKNRLVLRCTIYANTLHILASWDDDKGEVYGRVSNRM